MEAIMTGTNRWNNKYIKAALVCAIFAVITMIGMIRTAFILDAFSFSIVPLGLAIAVIITSKDHLLTKKYLIWDILLAGLFFVMLSAEEVFKMFAKMDGELINRIFKVVYIPVLFVSVMMLIDRFINMSQNLPENVRGGGATP